jgi:putative tryptophan/tyrosine transport system substrate-binding protein
VALNIIRSIAHDQPQKKFQISLARFWILDFRLERGRMKVISSKGVSDSCSNNPKPVLSFVEGSAIQNPKWLGLSLIAFVLVVVGPLANAQQSKKVFRLGFISVQDSASESARAEAIRLALRERGYIEGQNIAFEYRYADGKRDRLPELATQLVRLNLDVIVALGGDLLVRPIKNATKTIAIVMVGQGNDPVGAGLVESLARPGGNVTGLTLLGPELAGKRLELFKEAVPKIARVAVLYEPANPGSVLQMKEALPSAARALGLTLRSWRVRAADDFEKEFAAMSKQRLDGLFVLGGPLMTVYLKRIADFALESRLPSTYYNREAVDIGGLMYYGADLADSYRRVAYYVDKILKGAKPAELPVEQPKKFEFVINLKTAKQIGLTIPPNVLARADKVIR